MLPQIRLAESAFYSPALCRVLRRAIAVLVFAVVLVGPRASGLFAQKISEYEWKRGYHGLSLIATEGLGLEHIKSFGQWQRAPARESILIVLGSKHSSQKADRLRLLRQTQIDRYLREGGAVLVATDHSFAAGVAQDVGFQFQKVQVDDPIDSFQGYSDCPVVTDLELPYVSGVKRVVTNRPGKILVGPRTPWPVLGYLPPCNNTGRKITFAVGGEQDNGAKMICFADQSIFSNQMLPRGDNALLAKATIEYLKGADRNSVLILNNGSVVPFINPAELDVELPQPTREEIIDAMNELPPSAVLDFANSVIGVVEDENMVNQFINDSIDKIRPEKVNRFWIFCAFALGCLVATVTYLFQKKLKRTTSSDIAFRKAEFNQRHQKKITNSQASKSKLCFERQMAVLSMLDKFCIERVDRRFNDLKRFPDEIVDVGDEQGMAIKRAMRLIHDDFKAKPRDFWTTKRLLGVEAAIKHWREYFKMGISTRSVQSGEANTDSK